MKISSSFCADLIHFRTHSPFGRVPKSFIDGSISVADGYVSIWRARAVCSS